MFEFDYAALDLPADAVICGVDEAGRGPLAGPVCAAAVILPRGLQIDGLDDSKKLTAKRRDLLFDEITRLAVGFGIGWASVQEIDEHNILNATYIAMNRAIAALPSQPDLCLIDGNRATGVQYENRCIIGGDGLCAEIAAASILAKVERDRLMQTLHAQYPQYGLDKHKGYPTKAHYAALDAHGTAPIHRLSFLRKWKKGAAR